MQMKHCVFSFYSSKNDCTHTGGVLNDVLAVLYNCKVGYNFCLMMPSFLKRFCKFHRTVFNFSTTYSWKKIEIICYIVVTVHRRSVEVKWNSRSRFAAKFHPALISFPLYPFSHFLNSTFGERVK